MAGFIDKLLGIESVPIESNVNRIENLMRYHENQSAQRYATLGGDLSVISGELACLREQINEVAGLKKQVRELQNSVNALCGQIGTRGGVLDLLKKT